MPATPTQMNLRRSPRRSTQTRTANALSKAPLGSLRTGGRRSLGTLNRPGAAPRLTPTKASVASPLGGKENSCQDGEEGGKPFAATEPSDDKCKRNLWAGFHEDDSIMASEGSDDDSEDSLEHPPFDSSLSGKYRSDSSGDGSLASCADSGAGAKKGIGASTQAHYPSVPTEIKIRLQDDDVIICPGLRDQLEEERKSLRQYQDLYADATSENSAKDAIIKQRTEERDMANEALKGMKENLATTDIQRNAYKAENELLNVKLVRASARAAKAEKKLDRRDAELAECKSASERQMKTLKTVLKEESEAEVVAERMQGRAREQALTKQLAQSNADKKKLQADVDAVRAQRDEERNRARDSEKAWADKLAKSNAGLIKYQSDNEKLKLAVGAERNNGRVREKAWGVERERSNSANAKLETERVEASASKRVMREQLDKVRSENDRIVSLYEATKTRFQRTVDEKNRVAAAKSALEKKMMNERALALAMGCLLILVFISWLMERAVAAGQALVDWFGV